MNSTPPPRTARTAAALVSTSSRRRGCSLVLALTACTMFGFAMLQAQTSPAGSVAGRVQNGATGSALNNARVAVIGTNLLTFTDESGTYHLSGVPAGRATLRVFFTGFTEEEISIDVPGGQLVRQDIELRSKALAPTVDGAVRLDPLTVESTRMTDAAAIAVNEQRFANNIISVVSTDEFGTMVDSNPGEFLKFLPGIDVEYFANNITGVSVRGLGANNSELNFDGMTVASMNSESAGRYFEIQYASMADIARAEIRKLPLPEDSSNSIGGSINLIRRSAFEYSKRQIRYQLLFRSDGEKLTFESMDGPRDRRVPRWRPNWQIAWTEPVTKNFGFSVTLGQEDTVVNTHWALPRWNLGNAANNAAAEAAIAAGRPIPNVPSIYNPAMQNPLNHNAPLQQGKEYATLRVDWRPRPELKLGWSLSGSNGWKRVADDIRYVWNAAQIGSGDVARYSDANRTLGRLGGGTARQESPLWRDIYLPGIGTVLNAQWKTGAWEVSGKGGWSISRHKYYDTEHGFFNSTSVPGQAGLINVPETGVGAGTANPLSLTLNFAHDYWGPKAIDAFTTATGLAPSGAAASDPASWDTPVEWWNLDVARIGGARARPGSSREIVTSSKVFVKRHFALENPLSAQLGLDWSERFRNREYLFHSWRFVGRDGIPNTADDAARLIAADHLPQRPDSEYHFPGTQRISLSKFYDLYKANPSWFEYEEERSALRSLTSDHAYDLKEEIYAPYLQFDWRLRHRLRLTGGVRYERAQAVARGLLTDNTAAYLKYADGSFVRLNDRDAAGTALVINRGTATAVDYHLPFGPSRLPAVRAGAPIFLPAIQQAGNALRAAGKTLDTNTNLGRGTLLHTQTVFTRKGATNAGENEGYFPSLHGSYAFTDNFTWQLGYARTQGRLNFQDALIPRNEVAEASTNEFGEPILGRITLQNPNLKPWTADNFETRVNYFTPSGGVFGFGLFRKNVSNFQPQVDTPPITREMLPALQSAFPDLELGEQHVGYALRFRINRGTARLDGAEAEVRQKLDAFLPAWAKGFVINGTASYLNRKGANSNELGANRAWTNSAYLAYQSRKFSGRFGYRMNGLRVLAPMISNNGKVGKSVREAEHFYEVQFEYALTKWAKLFVAGQNLGNARRVDEQRYPERPVWANLATSHNYGRTFTIGVTGDFGSAPFRLPWNR